jgi:cytochrome c
MNRAMLLTLSMLAATGTAYADGDSVKGEQIYKKCLVCHSITDTKNKIGPSLLGIMDKKAGTVEGFVYSAAFRKYAETGVVWDDSTLDAWIANPKAVVSGTKMAFVGIKDDTVRADLIAYLKTNK